MDKNEFREKTEQMLEFIKQKSYKEAVELADTIDWSKIKNVSALSMAGEIYECCGQYDKSRELFISAYEKSPESKKIVYRLGALALKMGDIAEAANCYEEFIAIAPKDPNRFILKYKILRAQNAPIQSQIETLEEFKSVEYIEKWAFELAKLYDEAGMTAKCLEECDDLALWFSEGKFVCKAMELKMKYKPLTPLQQEKYDKKMNPKTEEPTEEPTAEETVAEEVVAQAPVVEEPIAEEPIAEEPITDEPIAQELEEETPTEEVAAEDKGSEEVSEEVEEEPIEIEDEPQVQKSPTSGLSVQEILQDWEEKQKENAQMILAEQERVMKEKESEEPALKEETGEGDILPDDVRKLMEELETESAEITAQKVVQPAPQTKKFATGSLPDLASVASAVGSAVAGVASAVRAADTVEKAVETAVAEGVTEAVADVAEDVAEAVETIVEIDAESKEENGIRLGETQEIMNAAKALMNDEVVETPEVEAPELRKHNRSKYDTGFIVQGRYDLEAQSEVGLKAGLTEEQKKLFSYFVPVHGMSEQLVDVIDKDKKCRSRYGTSRTGNLLIVGRKGSGKTVLAVNIVKAIQKARRVRHGKLAIVAAEALNKKDISRILEKLNGGAIVIEHASRLNKRTISQLSDLMEEQTGELLVVLEDERKPLERMLDANPRFQKKFTSRVELPVFINDELVTFGQTYAKENGYRIDEMGILALYSHIDMMQRDEAVVTVADVKELIDAAIEHANHFNVKQLAKKIFGKAKDEADRVLLTEEDFKL